MKATLVAVALAAAGVMGFSFWVIAKRYCAQMRLRKLYKKTVTRDSDVLYIPHSCNGFERIVVERMMVLSVCMGNSYRVTQNSFHRGLGIIQRMLMRYGTSKNKREVLQTLIDQAGLRLQLTIEGVVMCRIQSMMLGCVIGLVIGACLSLIMLFLGCILGLILGWNTPVWVLDHVRQERGSTMEQELGNLIEIIILGLRSGLSFDKAFSLYPHYFKSALADTCALAQAQWMHGLITRNEGLEFIAHSYDSALLQRVIASMERSLKFGTSLVDILDAEVQESRAIRKAKMEERISKAPVKMLFPVGVLILPAMLIYIMGPILLDLVSGF